MLQIWRICAKITCGLLAADQKQQKSNFGFIRYVKYAVRYQFFVDKAGDFCIYYRSIDGSFECPSDVEAIGGVSWYYLPLIVESYQGFRGIHELTRRKPKENHDHIRTVMFSVWEHRKKLCWVWDRINAHNIIAIFTGWRGWRRAELSHLCTGSIVQHIDAFTGHCG